MAVLESPVRIVRFPDHNDLPCSDGTFVQNFQEHPQAMLLSDTLAPVLQGLHPDGRYAVGQDSGIYWRVTEPAHRGATAPDWFYVPDVPPLLDGKPRRSYVMWQEWVAPLIAIEFASGDGSTERDATPVEGKFWIYERAIRIPFYINFVATDPSVEGWRLINGRYVPIAPDAAGRLAVEPMGVSFGLWRGRYGNMDAVWLRAWDSSGAMLPTADERTEQQRRIAEQQQRIAEEQQRIAEQQQRIAEEQQRIAEQQRSRAEALAAKLREMGVDPEA